MRNDEDDDQPDIELPHPRVLLLQERWAALQERKRLALRAGKATTVRTRRGTDATPNAALGAERPADVRPGPAGTADQGPAAAPSPAAGGAGPGPSPAGVDQAELHPALERKPALVPKQRAPKGPTGKTYDNVMRAIGRPCTQREIAERAGVEQASVSVWLKKHGKGAGVIDIGVDLTATTPRKPRLYMLENG